MKKLVFIILIVMGLSTAISLTACDNHGFGHDTLDTNFKSFTLDRTNDSLLTRPDKSFLLEGGTNGSSSQDIDIKQVEGPLKNYGLFTVHCRGTLCTELSPRESDGKTVLFHVEEGTYDNVEGLLWDGEARMYVYDPLGIKRHLKNFPYNRDLLTNCELDIYIKNYGFAAKLEKLEWLCYQ